MGVGTFSRHVHARTPVEVGGGGRLGRAGSVGVASGRDDAVECVGQVLDLVDNLTIMRLEANLSAE